MYKKRNLQSCTDVVNFDISSLSYPRDRFELISVDRIDTWDIPHRYTLKDGTCKNYMTTGTSVLITVKCKRCGSVKQVVDRTTISCKQGPCHRNWKDLTGRTFGDLTAISYVFTASSKGRHKKWYWVCQCACGRMFLKTSHDLLISKHIMCGYCARKIVISKTTLPNNMEKWHREYRICKKNALSRGYDFALTFDRFMYLCMQPCYYCGAAPIERSTGLVKNGVDRYDNTKGYTKQNSVPCCPICNRIKMDMTVEFMLEHLRRMLQYCEERSTTISKESTPKQVETGSTKNS